MSLYARILDAFGVAKEPDTDTGTEAKIREDDVFLIRHRNPDGTVSYEATEDLMKAAAQAASRVPPPDFSKKAASAYGTAP